jgi:DNA-binding PucR family transcriptional regulator
VTTLPPCAWSRTASPVLSASCGGSTEATARALFCHPNAVRYRLNRVTEHTARVLTDPQAVTELSLALHADRLARCA